MLSAIEVPFHRRGVLVWIPINFLTAVPILAYCEDVLQIPLDDFRHCPNISTGYSIERLCGLLRDAALNQRLALYENRPSDSTRSVIFREGCSPLCCQCFARPRGTGVFVSGKPFVCIGRCRTNSLPMEKKNQSAPLSANEIT